MAVGRQPQSCESLILSRQTLLQRCGLAWARVLLFVCLTLAASQGLPYILTSEAYPGAKPVHPNFPIAVLKDGAPAVVRWRDYELNPSQYQSKLLIPTTATPTRHALAEHDTLEVTPRADGVLDVKYSDEGTIFWSRYRVANHQVTPIAFRFSGPFVAYWALLVAGLGTILIPLGFSRSIRWGRRARADALAPL